MGVCSPKAMTGGLSPSSFSRNGCISGGQSASCIGKQPYDRGLHYRTQVISAPSSLCAVTMPRDVHKCCRELFRVSIHICTLRWRAHHQCRSEVSEAP